MANMLSDPRGVTAADGTAKARIERAALHLFVEKSIEGVSTKSIAALAGVSEGLLYRHFKSKADLSQILMQAMHNRLTQMMRENMDQSLEAAVCDIVRDYALLADEDWTLFAYHLLNMHRYPNLAEDGPLRAAADLVHIYVISCVLFSLVPGRAALMAALRRYTKVMTWGMRRNVFCPK